MTMRNAILSALSDAELLDVIQRLHFAEAKSLRDVARTLGVPYPSFQSELRRRGISVKQRGQSLKDKFNGRGPNWAGGRTIFQRPGRLPYVLIFRPEHPNANSRGYVYEHRYVVAMKIGRPLTDREVVHHVNGDSMDNRLENLEVRWRGGAGSYHGPLTVCPICGHDLLKQQ